MVMRQSTADRARLAEILALGGLPVRDVARRLGVCERTVKRLRRSDAARQERAKILRQLSELAVKVRVEQLQIGEPPILQGPKLFLERMEALFEKYFPGKRWEK